MAMDPRVKPAGDARECARPAPPLCSPHRLLHHGDQLPERERLGQEIELLVVGQALVEGVLGVAGYEDDLDLGVALLELLHQGRTVHLRHDHVGDDEINRSVATLELLQRLDAIAGLDHGVAA